MAENIVMPKLGLTMIEGTVDVWYKKIGDKVSKGEAVVSISSEKLNNDVESPIDGGLLAILTDSGGVVPVQEPIGVVGEPGEESEIVKQDKLKTESPESKSSVQPTIVEASKKDVVENAGTRIFATPSARKLARAKQIELSDIKGTGGNGRITRSDVENYVPEKSLKEETTLIPEGKIGEEPTILIANELVGMRKIIAQRMHRSLQQTAQVTLQRKADISALMEFRNEISSKTENEKIKNAVNLNVLLIKAVSLALRDHPNMNAWYTNGQYQLVDDIHMGIAVAVKEGLVVPVLKNTMNKSLSTLADEFVEITTSAQNGTLDSHLYSGSTFTISNMGKTGAEYFTPILNTPEIGILGVGQSSPKLILSDEQELEEHLELPLSLTFDHQVVDGIPAGEFLKQICFYLENPYALML